MASLGRRRTWGHRDVFYESYWIKSLRLSSSRSNLPGSRLGTARGAFHG